MAYYKVRIEVWCDWNPAESDLEDIAQSMGVGEAICIMREVVAGSVTNQAAMVRAFFSVISSSARSQSSTSWPSFLPLAS